MKGHLCFYSSLHKTKLDDKWFGGGDEVGRKKNEARPV